MTVRELQQSLKIGLHIRERQALRHKSNRAVRALQRAGQGIIVADRASPRVHHTRLLEDVSPDGGASAPAEIFPFFAQHGDYWRIPCSEYGGRWIDAIGNQPAHGGRRAPPPAS